MSDVTTDVFTVYAVDVSNSCNGSCDVVMPIAILASSALDPRTVG